MRNIYFQFQDSTGCWITVNTSSEPLSETEIMVGLKNVKLMKPNSRARVVDHDGRLIDIIP